MKSRLFYPFSALSLLCLFFLSGCNGKTSTPSANIINSSSRLAVDDSSFVKSYKDGDTVDFSLLKVTFDSTALTYSDSVNTTPDTFYVIDNPANPTVSVRNNSKVQSNKKSSEVVIYVAYHTEVSGDSTYYVSAPLTLTVTNSNALSPWVLYTVTGIVFAALIGFSFWKTNRNKKKAKPITSSPKANTDKKENGPASIPTSEPKKENMDDSSDDEEV